MKTLAACLGALLCCLLVASAAAAKDLSTIYDLSTLANGLAVHEKTTQKIVDQVIWPALSDSERSALSGVRFEYPLVPDAAMRGSPLSFYAPFSGDRVVMPESSLKFLDDLCTAYAWLQVHGYGVETVSEYTGLLRHKDFAAGRFPQPLPSLQIPQHALRDQQVNDLSLAHFVTARTFILLHELGHVIHYRGVPEAEWQRRDRTLAQLLAMSRASEEAADRFAIRVMQRTPLPPIGMMIFFMADAHFSSFPAVYSEKEWQHYLDNYSTHPLTGARLHILAAELRDRGLAALIDQLGKELDDPDTQLGVMATARASDLSMLAPRPPKTLPRLSTALPAPGPQPAFHGSYRGSLSQAGEPGRVPLEVVLERSGDRVTGRYTVGFGVGWLSGIIDGNRLHLRWQWSGNYGRAILTPTSDGAGFEGSWGYRESATNAGTWGGQRTQ